MLEKGNERGTESKGFCGGRSAVSEERAEDGWVSTLQVAGRLALKMTPCDWIQRTGFVASRERFAPLAGRLSRSKRWSERGSD